MHLEYSSSLSNGTRSVPPLHLQSNGRPWCEVENSKAVTLCMEDVGSSLITICGYKLIKWVREASSALRLVKVYYKKDRVWQQSRLRRRPNRRTPRRKTKTLL